MCKCLGALLYKHFVHELSPREHREMMFAARSVRSRYFVPNEDWEDYLIELELSLSRTYHKYDPARLPWLSWCNMVAQRQLFNFFRKKTSKHKQFYLLSDVAEYEADDESSLGTVDPWESADLAMMAEREAELLSISLTERERLVLAAFLEGHGITSAAAYLGLRPKQVDNTIANVRRKARSLRLFSSMDRLSA